MGRAKHFSPSEDGILKLLWERNCRLTTIARTIRRSVSGVRNRVKKLDSVAKRAISAGMKARRQKVLQLLRHRTNRHGRVVFKYPSTSAIASKIGVSKATVWRDLRASGCVCRVRSSVPTVSADDFVRRLRFARKQMNLNPRRILFTDEVILSTNDSHLCRTQWVRKGETPEGRLRSRWPSGRVMIHGAIGYNFRHLLVFDGERLTGDSYKRKVLFKLVPLCLQRSLVLQQDGARPHIARGCRDYIRRKNCSLLDDWPARSPQLNVIEQLWPRLHAAVAQHAAETQTQLIAAIREEWQRIPQADINNLIDSFPKKCKKCVENKGKL